MTLKKSEADRRYLYVWDTKVNGLFEQLLRVEKVSGDGPHDRDSKVRAVENYYLEQNLVGTPQDPKEYFKGTLSMRWGMYDDIESRPRDRPPLVYFGGLDPTTPLIVGLGGSSVHVLGHAGASSTHSRAATPTLVRWIVGGLYDEQSLFVLHREMEFGITRDLFVGIGAALLYLKPPTQQLEFLAKKVCAVKECRGLEYLSGCEKTDVALGVPVYVRQTRPLPERAGFGLDDEWKEHFKTVRR